MLQTLPPQKILIVNEEKGYMYKDDFNNVQREFYWSAPRVLLAIVFMMVVVYTIGFVATGGDLAIYRFWAPKRENARRVVFQNTQSYVQGKQEYISRLRFQYQTAERRYECGGSKSPLNTVKQDKWNPRNGAVLLLTGSPTKSA